MTDSESEVLGAARAAVLMLRDRHQAGKTTDRLEILVGYSGGCDSVVLLDALQSVAAGNAVGVTALHVHHGLSPNADRWADFCAEECSCRGIALVVRRVSVARVAGESLEAAARAARYAAFASAAADALHITPTIRPKPSCFNFCAGRVRMGSQPCPLFGRTPGLY